MRKKFIIFMIIFLSFIAIISLVYIISNNSDKYDNNPGGTGGDYQPINDISIKNGGIIYKNLGATAAGKITQLIREAVIYNTSINTNVSFNDTYNNSGLFKPEVNKLYKVDKFYIVEIENNLINLQERSLNYWFTIKTDDDRRFKFSSKVQDDGSENISIDKI